LTDQTTARLAHLTWDYDHRRLEASFHRTLAGALLALEARPKPNTRPGQRAQFAAAARQRSSRAGWANVRTLA
jgi:hypothetical protein